MSGYTKEQRSLNANDARTNTDWRGDAAMAIQGATDSYSWHSRTAQRLLAALDLVAEQRDYIKRLVEATARLHINLGDKCSCGKVLMAQPPVYEYQKAASSKYHDLHLADVLKV